MRLEAANFTAGKSQGRRILEWPRLNPCVGATICSKFKMTNTTRDALTRSFPPPTLENLRLEGAS